jgi:hypothetical protein
MYGWKYETKCGITIMQLKGPRPKTAIMHPGRFGVLRRFETVAVLLMGTPGSIHALPCICLPL